MKKSEIERYRIRAKLNVYRRRVDLSLAKIQEALSSYHGTWSVSYSGGKDSTVLLHLCLRAGWRGPLFFFWYEETPDDVLEQVTAESKRLGLDLHMLKTIGEFDAFERVGHFFISPTTSEEIEAAKWMRSEWAKAIRAYPNDQGWVGTFMGLRKAESRARKTILNKKGQIYTTRDRPQATCCPISNWAGDDIWAYIVRHELPYLPSYDLAEDRERHRSEIVFFYNETFFCFDGLNQIKETRPDYYRKLVSRWPEIPSLK